MRLESADSGLFIGGSSVDILSSVEGSTATVGRSGISFAFSMGSFGGVGLLFAGKKVKLRFEKKCLG